MKRLRLSLLRWKYNRTLTKLRADDHNDPHYYASLQLRAMRYLVQINALRTRV